MLIPKDEFKNTVINVRVGNATIQIKAEDITQKHIEAYKNHVDLTYFVEEFTISEEPRKELLDLQEYDPQKHDIKNVIQAEIDNRLEEEKPKKTRTRKKK